MMLLTFCLDCRRPVFALAIFAIFCVFCHSSSQARVSPRPGPILCYYAPMYFRCCFVILLVRSSAVRRSFNSRHYQHRRPRRGRVAVGLQPVAVGWTLNTHSLAHLIVVWQAIHLGHARGTWHAIHLTKVSSTTVSQTVLLQNQREPELAGNICS